MWWRHEFLIPTKRHELKLLPFDDLFGISHYALECKTHARAVN